MNGSSPPRSIGSLSACLALLSWWLVLLLVSLLLVVVVVLLLLRVGVAVTLTIDVPFPFASTFDRHRLQVDPDSLCPDDMFIEQMGSLLDDDEHCDVTFFVGPSRTEVCNRMTRQYAQQVYSSRSVRYLSRRFPNLPRPYENVSWSKIGRN